jgi:D-sedoheptulose 7-phosphate isomerase
MTNKLNLKEEFSKNYKKNLIDIINKVSDSEIADFIDILLKARGQESIVYFIGNGGSASTASHFVNDLTIGTKLIDKPFRAISLCDNQSIITAIANDYGYEYIFSKQLAVLLKENDVVVAISASGNSPNLIKALNVAKDKGIATVGLSAFDGGKLKNLVDISVHVPTAQGAYGPAEDVHMILDHLVTSCLTSIIIKERKNG